MFKYLARKISRNKRTKLFSLLYRNFDYYFKLFDDKVNRISKNCTLIPNENLRYGGQRSLSEYAHTIAIFQSLLHIYINKRKDAEILDFGCGTGKLAISCLPFLGTYYGIDTSIEDINKANNHYKIDNLNFINVPARNKLYNITGINPDSTNWPVKDNTLDAVVGCSIFTHLNEQDAIYYMDLIAKKLKNGGIAVLSFFLLDSDYFNNNFDSTRWDFDKKYLGSEHWYYSSKFKVPEAQIGIDEKGIAKLIDKKFIIKNILNGSWKVKYGLFFQDILVLERNNKF